MEKDYIQEIDQIRHIEYPLLRGTTLYSKSLIQQFSDDMCSNLFGNPHSASPSSALSTQRTEHVRSRVLEFFKADPEHFDVVFVANATAAIKLVMHAFQDSASKSSSHGVGGFWYGYHCDAHNSLVGIREVASGGSRCFKSNKEVEEWLEGKSDTDAVSGGPDDSQLSLFAYPAQSNMNGHRLPLEWSGRIRSSPHTSHKNTYTMLDAAAFVATAQLDLSDHNTAPDFTALSFYKIFGFPDLGALIVRKAAGHILQQRRYFGGGTVDMVIALDEVWHMKKEKELHEALEDGTIPFHSIIALDSALDSHLRLFGSMARISAHACYLARVLYEGLVSLRHDNGLPVCEIYKNAESTYGNSKTQAPTVAFNVRNGQGGWVPKGAFEELAIVRGIQIRTGGVCNPGGIATCLNLKPWELRKNFLEGLRCGQGFDVMSGKPTGIIRVSLGAMSSMGDVQHFLRFVRELFLEHALTSLPTPAALHATSPTHRVKVENIKIHPIRGAKSWTVPNDTAWEIKDSGLVWDREWCLVSTVTGQILTAKDHPRLQLLEPSLHPEDGNLKISFPDTFTDEPNNPKSISVSLWEIPPSKPEPPETTEIKHARLAIAYQSPSLADMFSSFLNFPCTLARFPVQSAVPQQANSENFSPVAVRQTIPHETSSMHINQATHQPSHVTRQMPVQSSLTISTSPASATTSNITTTSPLGTSSWEHIRIGSQYFLSLDDATPSCRRLQHLPNRFDRSLASQNTTIRAGDILQVFSVNKNINGSSSSSTEEGALQACIASTSALEFICPAATCWQGFASREEYSEHLLHHKTSSAAGAERQMTEREQSFKTSKAMARGKQHWGTVLLRAKPNLSLSDSGSSSNEKAASKRIPRVMGRGTANEKKSSKWPTTTFRATVRGRPHR